MVALDELVDSWMIDLTRKIAFHFKQDGLVVMKRRDELNVKVDRRGEEGRGETEKGERRQEIQREICRVSGQSTRIVRDLSVSTGCVGESAV